MLSALQIKGFRSFRQLSVKGLTPVSLLVGANNAGKTSVLEAAELVLGGAGISVLSRSVRRRGETVRAPEETAFDRLGLVSHLFYGHRLEQNVTFRIEAKDTEKRFFSCTLLPIENTKDLKPQQLLMFRPIAGRRITSSVRSEVFEPTSALSIAADGTPEPLVVPLYGEGFPLLFDRTGSTTRPPLKFIGTATPTIGALQELWDSVVLTPEEERVTEVLRIIEPGIERIAALASSERGADASIFVKLQDTEQRIPIGSMGEGIKRLLALSLNLTSAANGYLLVDEIDTGLHHSVMVKMWRLVVKAAERLNLQVLATTHSLDCVHSLAALYEQDRDTRDLISLHRIERGTEASIPYSADELLAAAKHQMELR